MSNVNVDMAGLSMREASQTPYAMHGTVTIDGELFCKLWQYKQDAVESEQQIAKLKAELSALKSSQAAARVALADDFTMNDYQKQAATFEEGSNIAERTVLGLTEEAGEASGVRKRWLRGDYDKVDVPTDEAEASYVVDLSYELGDVLWYVAMCAKAHDLTLEDVARRNIRKLASRKARGVIKGSGDNR